MKIRFKNIIPILAIIVTASIQVTCFKADRTNPNDPKSTTFTENDPFAGHPIRVDPYDHHFDDQDVGTHSVRQTFQIMNTSANEVLIYDIKSLDQAVFQLFIQQQETPFNLFPGNIISFEVEFAPQNQEAYSNKIQITYNEFNGPQIEVDVSGNGVNNGIEEGLVGHWNFEEGNMQSVSEGGNVPDVSGNSLVYPGTFFGTLGATRAWYVNSDNPISDNPISSSGNSIGFMDNSEVCIDMGNYPELNFSTPTSQFTIQFWVKLFSFTQDGALVSKWGDGTDFQQGWLVKHTSYGAIAFVISKDGMMEELWIETDSMDQLATGVWYHIACTADIGNDVYEIYMNGQLKRNEQFINIESINLNTASFTIGSADDNFYAPSPDALIDEVKLFSVVRSPVDIQNSFNESKK